MLRPAPQHPSGAAGPAAGIPAAGGHGYTVEVDTVANDAWDTIAGGFADINPEQTACYATHHWKGTVYLGSQGVP